MPCRGKSSTSAELGLSKTQPPGHPDSIPQEKVEPFLTLQCSPTFEIKKTTCSHVFSCKISCVFCRCNEKQLKEERKYLASTSPHSPSLREVRAGSRGQELMQRPQRVLLSGVLPKGLLSLLSYRSQGHHPRDGTTHSRLGPPHQS